MARQRTYTPVTPLHAALHSLKQGIGVGVFLVREPQLRLRRPTPLLYIELSTLLYTVAYVFTARRYASAVLGVVILSVRPSVRLSVTRVLCD